MFSLSNCARLVISKKENLVEESHPNREKHAANKHRLLISKGAVLMIGFVLIGYHLRAVNTAPPTRLDAPTSFEESQREESVSPSTGELSPNLPDSVRSVQGREIKVHRYAGRTAEKIIIVGGIHGNEPESVIFAQALVDHLNAMEPGFLTKNLIVVPLLNPDAYAAGTRRNSHGVDINRNFATLDFQVGDPDHKYYGGETAGSEPETRFILNLMEAEKPDLVMMLHTPYNFINSDGDSLGLGPKLAQELGLEYHEAMDYPTPGSIGTYFGKERQIPVITVELPSEPDVWKRFGKKLLQTLME